MALRLLGRHSITYASPLFAFFLKNNKHPKMSMDGIEKVLPAHWTASILEQPLSQAGFCSTGS
jgi:hypothetical protein